MEDFPFRNGNFQIDGLNRVVTLNDVSVRIPLLSEVKSIGISTNPAPVSGIRSLNPLTIAFVAPTALMVLVPTNGPFSFQPTVGWSGGLKLAGIGDGA